MITAKLDLAKITGAKVLKKDGRTFIEITSCGLFEGKTGAQYLDIALFDTPEDKFGNDWRITQSVSAEARQRGEKGPILGNGKNRGGARPAASQSPTTGSTGGRPAHSPNENNNNVDEDVPFACEKGI